VVSGRARKLVATGAVFVLAAVSASIAVAAGHVAGHTRTYSTRATAPLATAVSDPVLFAGSQMAEAFARTRAAGATYARVTVNWRSVAPATPPAGFVATDPTSPGYRWAGLDAVVNTAESAGLTPILDLMYPPWWAYDTQPTAVNEGSPNVADLGDFATALATHYNGLTPGAPAERVFQVWNEPNLSLDMSPVSASKYRDMVNAVADAVHAVDPANLVVAGGLDPFGHKKAKNQEWYSIAPLTFMRSLLCLSKGSHPHSTCQGSIRFDVWSHHPYTPYLHGGPFAHAKLPGDVELGDLPRMRAVLKAGVRLGQVVSSNPVQFWVTEFGWNTNPPRKHSPSLGLAARWTSESLHQMWLSGVSLVTWFLLEDLPAPSYYKSGLFFHSTSVDQARAKPMRTAFRFPFVAYRHGSTVSIWGRDATSDKELVTVQRRHGNRGAWRTVAHVRSNAYGIFRATVRLKTSKTDWLRAIAPGSGKSLAFSLVPDSRAK
jgi:Cellulase (glycosyl hydrolase family 5)